MTKKLIEAFTLKNDQLEVRFLNVGGAITKIAMAADDFSENLVLAYDEPSDYLDNKIFLNTLIGRTSNRIKNGRFTLNGTDYQLDLNDGSNNLHGGVDNLTHKIFKVAPIENGYELTATLEEEPFPGNLDITVKYELDRDTLVVTYEATTDKATIVNLTHHAYFNLSGNAKRTVTDHLFTMPAQQIAEVDETSAFTEHLTDVALTRFDFNETRPIKPPAQEDGYDHLFILSGTNPAATVKDPESGRQLIISTTEPAMQFYSGIWMDDSLTFEGGRKGEKFLGACFETHKIPYDYDSQTLNPGETYYQQTKFQFVKK